MPRMDFLLFFLLAHLIGDYALQTNKISSMKAAGSKGLAVHAAIVTTAQGLILSVFGFYGILAGVLSGVLHFGIDLVKNKVNRYFLKLQSVYYGIDQLLHFLVIYLLTLLFAGKASDMSIYIPAAAVFICAILLIYVSTVNVKIILLDAFREEFKSKPFFALNERLADAAVSVFFWGALRLPLLYAFLISGVIWSGYIFYERRRLSYSNKIIALKVFVLGLTAYLCSNLL